MPPEREGAGQPTAPLGLGVDLGTSGLRLALVLASVALVFFAGFVAKIVLFGR